MSTARPRVAVIGAGVIGLSIGWRLAQAGSAVDVFDRGPAGAGASWAAAGMLAAGAEAEPGEERLLALNRASQSLWPAFARELEAASGIDVGYRREGTLILALNRDERERLRADYEFQRGLGVPLHWLSAAEAKRREPHVAAATLAAVHAPEDHQVDNRQVVRALIAACRAAGVRIRENVAALGIEVTAGRVAGVSFAGGRQGCDAVVLAAGAWSRQIPGLPPQALPPVRPIKGQMLALRMDPEAPLLRHVLWAARIYLVPRGSGRLVIGGTVEERGFDPQLTAGGMLALLQAAWRVLPGIEELAIEESWVGFRPGSPDDAPILGPSAIEGLVIATGHHRNGILLTPITARTVGDYVLTGRLAEAIRPFGPARFAGSGSDALMNGSEAWASASA
jgi:glycine oxidase